MRNITIPRYANLRCAELGHDSLKHAKSDFLRHGPVDYQFNAHGYRTHDFSQLDSSSILIFGDSFTLGLGINSCDRYSDILQETLGRKVFNISLNGASNDWISRRFIDFLNLVTPYAVIVHYTFSHRREYHDTTWHDDERTLCDATHSDQENYTNWKKNFDCISSHDAKIIHSFIPNWHTEQIDYACMPGLVIPPMKVLDVARDGFHYGIGTHQMIAQQFTNLLACG